MSRSLIQTTNQTTQSIAENSIISLGSVQRRFGCNLRLSGNAVEAVGEGYYTVSATVSVAPAATGPVTVAIYDNGVQIPGAIAYGTATAIGDLITLPLETTIRQGCNCDSADSLTVRLVENSGGVQNVSLRVEKA